MKTIYDLKLHETICVNELEVMKVPNGFIYYLYPHQPVFVPYESSSRADTGPR